MRRFNAPPGWPPAPDGWLPPDGWVPPADQPPAPAGWQWVIDDAPVQFAPPPSAPEPEKFHAFEDGRLFDFVSHINGRNARVRLYPDRLEWERKDVMTGGAKAATAVATMGMSYLATGVRQKRETEMILVKSITSVTTKKGLMNTAVKVVTSGHTIEMNVSHAEAERVKRELLALVGGTHPALQQATASAAPQIVVQTQQQSGHSLHALAEMHRQGILTDAEFSAAKARALGI